MITTLIQGGRAQGMQFMDDALMALVEQGKITPREAYMKATNKARFGGCPPPNRNHPASER